MQKLTLLFTIFFLTGCKGAPTEKKSAPPAPTPAAQESPPTPAPTQKTKNKTPIKHLRAHLSLLPVNQPDLAQQEFATTPLTREQAQQATSLILANRLATLRTTRQKEFDAKTITLHFKRSGKIYSRTLPYAYRTLGHTPPGGHSLYISMHGGGGAPAYVNTQQWRDQIKLYTPQEGIYLAPRAPTDTWDLWHLPHIDALFDRLIANFIAIKGINPNKVYLMGYSAGGDGTYQLAPRMADRWAAAAMMAGHPGDAQTHNLRNLPFIIQCGGKDTAYNRNKLAEEWGTRLKKLSESDPGGYPHKCIIYPLYGHWLHRDCKQALPWMAQYTRNPWPKKLHWYQDNITHNRLYWLTNPSPQPKQLITAEVKGQTITLTHSKFTLQNPPFKGAGESPPPHHRPNKTSPPIPTITLRLSDNLLDLDKPFTVKDSHGKTLHQGTAPRTILAIHHSLTERPDPTSAATATLVVPLLSK